LRGVKTIRQILFVVAAGLLATGRAADEAALLLPTYDGLRALVDDDLRHEIHPGDQAAGVPFWNQHAKFFQYPPRLGCEKLERAEKYRHYIYDDSHEVIERATTEPYLSAMDFWFDLPTGVVTVVSEGVDAKGKSVGLAGRRQFWKAAPFTGEYPHPKGAYVDAAKRIFEYMLSQPLVTDVTDRGEPNREYGLNAYETKMHGAILHGMLEYARLCPERRERALAIAKAEADYLISIMQPADAPLANFPLTYSAEALKTEERGAIEFRGQSMNIYPAHAATYFVMLYRVTRERKYLDAARRIADTFVKLQLPEGTWYIRQYLKDGRPVIENRMIPSDVCGVLEELAELTGERKYLETRARAVAWMENGPLRTYEWDGQFEDGLGEKPYVNLSKHMSSNAAFVMLRAHPGDPRYLAQARELLRFAEDQFVFWEKPGRPGPFEDPEWPFARKYYIPPAYRYPSAYEQYLCYLPIDASATKMIRFYLEMYRREHRILDLMKAKALADSILAVQREDGSVPTFWGRGIWGSKQHDWINCMSSSALALMKISEYQEICDALDTLARPAAIHPELQLVRDGRPVTPVWKGDEIDFMTMFPDGRSYGTPMPEYEVTGTGTVTVPEDGDYVLELDGDWRLWVKLDGREVFAMPDGTRTPVRHLQIVRLTKGAHAVDLRFGAGSSGASLRFRLTPAYMKSSAKPDPKSVIPAEYTF